MYIPKQQDIIYLDFEPQSGKKIKKRRSALVLSNNDYNKKTGLIAVTPITHTQKNNISYFKVNSKKVNGFVNANQVKTLDYRTRKAQFVEVATDELFFYTMQAIQDIFN